MATITPQLRFPEFKDEWQEKKLGEILTIGSGKDYKHLAEGNIPVYGSGGLMTFVNNYLNEGDTVCIGRKGTIDRPMFLQGKIWTVDTLFFTHSFVNTFAKFTYYLFSNINWKLYNEAGGVPSLSKSTISTIELNLPTLPEQTKIANFLTAVDEKIQALRKKKELTQQYKKGIMQRIFSQELRFTDENGNPFPDWEEKKLGEVAELTSSKRVHSSDYVKNGIPFFRGKEISVLKNKNLPIDLLYISEEQYKKLKEAYGVPQINDILITAVGTLGNIYLVINNDRFYFKDGNLIWMKNIKECSPFLAVLLSFHHEKVLSTSIGSSQKALTMEALNKLNFNFPSFPEQIKIANFLSAIDERIALIDTQLQQAEAWKKGLLQQMFC